MAGDQTRIAGVPLTRHWLIPQAQRPKGAHRIRPWPRDEIRRGTQRAWDQFYSLSNVWVRSRCVQSLKSRVAFVLISKLYRQMHANTGIATDSARVGGLRGGRAGSPIPPPAVHRPPHARLIRAGVVPNMAGQLHSARPRGRRVAIRRGRVGRHHLLPTDVSPLQRR